MLKICESVYNTLLFTLPTDRECGGILGKENGIVTSCTVDYGFFSTTAAYYPNISEINAAINRWRQNGIIFCGFFHTHLTNDATLSKQDREYITNIMTAVSEQQNRLLFPVIIPNQRIVFHKAHYLKNNLQIQEEVFEIIQQTKERSS